MKIKVCGMKYPENMKEVAGLGVDYLGFIFYPKSPRYMPQTMEPADLLSVPSHIKKVGVFVNEELETILKHAHNYGLSMIQLHGNETPDICEQIQHQGLEVLKAFSVDASFTSNLIKPYEQNVDYVLLDTKTKGHGGSGQKFDWSILNNLETDKPVILSGGIGPDDAEPIHQLLNKNIFALDLNSRFETEPGMKNIEQLQKLLREINY